jgi:YebC/PmpR family DNA-binding regulatory protein
VQKARDASMPKDNIERAIAKGSGADSEADAYESVLYEGYGPGGVAILVEVLTDNRNRTGSEVRHLFTKHGGSLGEPGSVAWTFEKKGEVVVDGGRYSEDDLLAAIDAGAEDVTMDGDVWEIVTGPGELAAVREVLEEAGVEIESSELVQRATTRTPVGEDRVGTLMRLIEGLEEHDDVQAVHANFDVDAAVLERVAAV